MKRTPRALRVGAAFAAAGALGLFASTSPSAPTARPHPFVGPERTVVIVAIDGVRWQDVFEGVDAGLATKHRLSPREVVPAAELVPNLHRLARAEGAAIGMDDRAPMIASGPNFVSLPGYMEMLTGLVDPGCRDNSCGRTRSVTVAEEVAAKTGKPGDAAVVASWTGIDRAASANPRSIAISVGRTTGATRDRIASNPYLRELLSRAEQAPPAPGHGDFRPDAHTGEIAIEYLRSHRPRFLFIGLGETDEHGHAKNYRGYLRALANADTTVGRVWEAVKHLNAAGHPTTLLVTTDHGRSRGFSDHGGEYPESARVWLIAAGPEIAARGHVASPETRRLADVAMTTRRILGLPTRSGTGVGKSLAELFAKAQEPLAWRVP